MVLYEKSSIATLITLILVNFETISAQVGQHSVRLRSMFKSDSVPVDAINCTLCLYCCTQFLNMVKIAFENFTILL